MAKSAGEAIERGEIKPEMKSMSEYTELERRIIAFASKRHAFTRLDLYGTAISLNYEEIDIWNDLDKVCHRLKPEPHQPEWYLKTSEELGLSTIEIIQIVQEFEAQ